MLRTARISDPDDVQRILHCKNEDEFFSVGKYKEPNAKKTPTDRKKKIQKTLQSIVATGVKCQSTRDTALCICSKLKKR